MDKIWELERLEHNLINNIPPKMKLVDVQKISDCEYKVEFDYRIRPNECGLTLQGMRPDAVVYFINAEKSKNKIFYLKPILYDEEFDVEEDLKIGNIFDYPEGYNEDNYETNLRELEKFRRDNKLLPLGTILRIYETNKRTRLY